MQTVEETFILRCGDDNVHFSDIQFVVSSRPIHILPSLFAESDGAAHPFGRLCIHDFRNFPQQPLVLSGKDFLVRHFFVEDDDRVFPSEETGGIGDILRGGDDAAVPGGGAGDGGT